MGAEPIRNSNYGVVSVVEARLPVKEQGQERILYDTPNTDE